MSMSTPKTIMNEEQFDDLIRLLNYRDEEGQSVIPDETLQRLMDGVVRLYSERVQRLFQSSQREVLSPFSKDTSVNTTDAIVTVSAMLKAYDLAAFEMAWFSDTQEWELKS